MTPSIVAIGTAVPATRLTQDEIREVFAAQPGVDRLTKRLIHAAFDASAIETRHTVLSDLAPGGRSDPEALEVRRDGLLLSPSTARRNDEFRRLAPALFADAARRALADAALEPDAVTHLVTVSCTGLYAPGPDVGLVRELGLDPGVERYHLGFVGCAAAMPALRAAHRIATARPGAVVLVVCTELCSLHLRASSDPQQIVAASVFADGASAAIVTSDDRFAGGTRLEFGEFATALTADGDEEMAWVIGDEGFEMTLSAEVPRIVGREVRGAAAAIQDCEVWAVHPGGRSVLDRVAAGLDLSEEQMTPSRRILREYGNMSSATILFILREILHDASAGETSVGALAFGPGLTVETARLSRRAPATA
ncbi:type III polyketide synthase [Microbacterium caowuchunii]|uniref:type III polyketide synthase n=1 Tax=Microbacterium caowuchunii TaxID=2614638 RepID=UPI0012443A42|nr:type III polyketide synthase [Microbacterium caowuchunii]QEW01188.1 type III polyketide synthase [Microbacterium caowuchunii]